MRRPPSALVVAAALAAGWGLRLWMAVGNYGNYDQTSYRIVADIMLRGGNVYAETIRYNYAPLWMLVLVPLAKLAAALAVPLSAVVKVFFALCDAGCAALLWRIARRMPEGPGAWAVVAYALHPVAILLVGHHGQMEPMAALPLLGAVLLALDPPSARRDAGILALVVLSLLAKHILFFIAFGILVHALKGFVRPVLAFGAALALWALSFLPWVATGREGIVRNVFGYAATGFHPYGLAALPRPVAFVVMFGVLLALPFVTRDLFRTDAARAASLLAVGTLALMPRMGENYLLIPALFGSATLGAGYLAFAAVGYFFLLHGPNNLQALTGPMPFGLLFASLMGWFVWDLVRTARRRPVR